MRLVRAAVALALLGLALVPSGAAAAESDATVRLTSQTPWLASGGIFDLHLAVREGQTPELRLAVTVHRRVASRSEFARTLDGELLRRAVKQLVVPLADVPLDTAGDRVVSLPLPRDDTPMTPATLPTLGEGVYPITVALETAGGDVVDRFITYLVRLPDSASIQPLSVAWIQIVGARPSIHADGTQSLTEADIVPVETAAAAISEHGDLPMTLDITPETVAALDSKVQFPLRLGLTDAHQLLASPFVDVDASALVTADRGEDLAAQRQLGEETLFETLGDRGDPRTWSADQPVTAAALERLRELGVIRVAVPESSLAPLPSALTRGLTVARPFRLATSEGDEVDAVSADAGLAAHFRNGASQVLSAHQLLADLAVLFFDAPGAARGVVVRPPVSWRANRSFLDVVLPSLAAAPILAPVTLDDLFDNVAPLEQDDSPLVRTTAASSRVEPLPSGRLDDAHRAVDSLSALVGPGTAPLTAARRRLLAGESYRLTNRARRALLDSVPGALDAVRARVLMPDRRTIRLTAREGTIPLTIINDNPFPVHVRLVLASDKLEFRGVDGPDRSRLVLDDLELTPGTHTRAVPVRARASATFSLRASLLAPDGEEIVRARFTISSTVFSGVGIVLSIGAGLFLLLWWARHWRTARRDRRLVEPPARADY